MRKTKEKKEKRQKHRSEEAATHRREERIGDQIDSKDKIAPLSECCY